MSDKSIPWDSHAYLAQSVRRLLAEAGPLSRREIVRRLRRADSTLLQASAINKVLNQTMADELERLPGDVYQLVGEELP